MKLRNRRLISAAAWCVARFVRGWIGTLRIHYEPVGPDFDPRRPGFEGRYLYAFWHENVLLPAYLYGRPDIHVLVSRHADGQLVAEAATRLGFSTVRGSTTRGGIEAVRQLMRCSQSAHLAVTPDGPQGPRRVVQSGVAYLASRTGLPVVVFGVGYDNPWRARSWDRFAVPRPFTRAVVVTAEPVLVPPDADKAILEHYRLKVQERLDFATELAEQLAAGRLNPRRLAA
jgi:lysophospholipid acyltransferase (LPLAT)-like uncharacterized protein